MSNLVEKVQSARVELYTDIRKIQAAAREAEKAALLLGQDSTAEALETIYADFAENAALAMNLTNEEYELAKTRLE